MLKKRTKTEFQIPTKRGIVTGIIRLIIDRLEINANNVIAHGYYYYFDTEQNVVVLDRFSPIKQLSDVFLAEQYVLGDLISNKHVFENIIQRLDELNVIQLTEEDGENYGTSPSDWELDIN